MITRPATPSDTPATDALFARRAATDRRPALSEHKALRVGDSGSIELVAVEETSVVGYAHIARHSASPGAEAHWAAELVPAPGLGTAFEQSVSQQLIAAGRERVAAHGERFVVWAWRSADQEAARESGLVEQRVLLQMGRPLPVALAWSVPVDVTLRRFRVGDDEERLRAANNRAFAGHPENGSLDLEDLRRRMKQPWFDPDGILLADRSDAILGFCWTKLHDGGIGEIYIVGVVPEAQGMGLGRTLVLAGLEDLADRQLASQAMLYTDGDDRRAVGLYQGLGFSTKFANRVFGVPEPA